MNTTNFLPFTLGIALAIATLPSLHAESRTWTDAASGKTIDGELIGVDGEQVTLRRADGKSFTIEISRFSAEDQEYIASQNTPADADGAGEDDDAMPAGSENDVTLTGLHLCCSGCEKAIEKALAEHEDIEFDISRSTDSINITSEKSSAVKYAVEAIGKAGYYGESNFAAVSIPETRGTSAEKTQSAEISGLHICCGKCESSIDDALTAVEGVESITLDKKGGKAVVEGEFSTQDAITALQAAGFNGSL